MTATGFETFDKFFQKTNAILTDIEEEMKWEDRREQSYAALRSVLHAFRDRLPVNDSANFAAQLPVIIKGVYFEGWDPSSVPRKMDKQEFIQAVQQSFNYSVEGGIPRVIEVVFNKIFAQIDEAERENLVQILPEDISSLLK